MKNGKMKSSAYHRIVNIVCPLQLVGIVVYLIMILGSIPDKIPMHYNAAGVIDRWGGKGELFILPVISWFLYLLITAVERFPQIWNTGVKLTQENKARVYRLVKNMLGTMKLVIVTAFTFITFNLSLMQALPAWFLPVFLFLIFAPIVFFIVKVIRAG